MAEQKHVGEKVGDKVWLSIRKKIQNFQITWSYPTTQSASVVGRIMSTAPLRCHPIKDGQVLTPSTCEYVMLHSKGELRFKKEFKLLNSWPWHGGRILLLPTRTQCNHKGLYMWNREALGNTASWGCSVLFLTDDAAAELVFMVWGPWGRVKCHHTSDKDCLSAFLNGWVLQLGMTDLQRVNSFTPGNLELDRRGSAHLN